MKTPQAITSLIKRYGLDVTHYKRPSADAESPWKTAEAVQKDGAAMRGIIQHLKADESRVLPEGGMKAVMILAVGKDQDDPMPGDDFMIANQRWRAATILPHSQSRQGRLFEVLVTSRGKADRRK